ncbi:hypothetical protein FLW16_37040 [Microbispora sp. KK1-11]|nr:hypothetical protein FLW16_37040 [Microbispora sp. KK1-11]
MHEVFPGGVTRRRPGHAGPVSGTGAAPWACRSSWSPGGCRPARPGRGGGPGRRRGRGPG